MKKRIILLLSLFLLLPSFIQPALADSGPKPTTTILFHGLDREDCYATLLADEPNIGPWYVDQEYPEWLAQDGISEALFQSFHDYGVDDWYFVGLIFNLSENKELNWNYYPPNRFRVMLYFPGSERWVLSAPYDRYAFDSYYVAEYDGTSDGELTVTADKTHWANVFLVRLAVTLIVELLIGMLFFLRTAKQFAVVSGTNLATQILLNLFLSTSLAAGWFGTMVMYPAAELTVFLIEAGIYSKTLCDERVGKRRLVLYALAANAASFFVGFLLPSMPHGI